MSEYENATPTTPEDDLFAPMVLSCEVRSIPVQFRNNSGAVENCQLLEMNGDQRDQYFEAMKKRMRFVDGKATGEVTDFKELSTLVLRGCLLRENGRPFAPAELQQLPAATIEALTARARKMNNLGEEAADEAKKK